jgi:hypothetical protein
MHMIYTKKLSIFFFNSLILGAFFINSCNQGGEKMASNQPKIAKETFGLLENYIQLELKRDSIFILQAPKIFITEMCATEIVKAKKLNLSVEELIAHSQSDTTMWTSHEFPGARILEYDRKTNSAKTSGLTNAGDKNGYYVLSRPIFSNDFNFAVLQAAFVCGPRCGQSETILFEKKDRIWHRLTSFCQSVY